ncbi:uncharacterized protein LY89DRAFT_776075 [Mollisia scopiformis]|uniref:Uncharacterized protein n=1 Tax=Mollisia scopiformis TaxID=149040 RepID=A0A194XUY8_MOLSC|nr:uncharacterized protein LY89DRAFT_776075 [Mollisia scopiformis]KUJ23849.1 hypothetical protein LY89DRAFT_776075 [Mollisia scopiformis]
MWYSALPSNLSPSQKPYPLTSISEGRVSPHLRARRATQAPLPDAVSPSLREALIRSSPKKARRFLTESFHSRAEQYDPAWRILPKASDSITNLRNPKSKKLSKKELKLAKLHKSKKLNVETSKVELTGLDAYNSKIAELCALRKLETEHAQKAKKAVESTDLMSANPITRFDSLIDFNDPLLLKITPGGHQLSADYFAKVTRDSTSKSSQSHKSSSRHRKRIACITFYERGRVVRGQKSAYIREWEKEAAKAARSRDEEADDNVDMFIQSFNRMGMS